MIAYDSIFTGRYETFFSTPITINNNKNLKKKIFAQEFPQGVEAFKN